MSRRTYTLRYLDQSGNSRTLQLSGRAYYSGEREGSPSGAAYDLATDSYREEDGRASFRPELVISTSLLNESELMEVVDMSLSADVRLVDWQGYDVKVIPSADEIFLQLLSMRPDSLKVRLRFAESDERYSPAPVTVPTGWRIHTATFSPQFN